MTNIIQTRPNGTVFPGTLEKVSDQIVFEGVAGGSFAPRSDYGWNKEIARYVVAVENCAVINLDKATSGEVLPALRDAIMIARHEHLRENLGCFAGFWVDNTDLYIDVNQSFDSLGEAMSIARERGELAIYDTVEGREIRVEAMVG